MTNTELYEQDFNAWINQQIHLLKTNQLNALDLVHLVDELEDMGNSRISELESRFLVLIAHLLKWQFQADKRSSSWRGSIQEQRIRIARLINKNPSLKPKMLEVMADVYQDAVEIATTETGLPVQTFPICCPYKTEQLLDKAFYP